MVTLEEKVEHAEGLFSYFIKEYGIERVGVASSFGKDSIVAVSLAKKVNLKTKVFSIMTPYKFNETFNYLVDMADNPNLHLRDGPFCVYIVKDSVPEVLEKANIDTVIFPELYAPVQRVIESLRKGIYGVADLMDIASREDLKEDLEKIKGITGLDIYEEISKEKSGPDLCCGIFKVYLTQQATKDLDVWVTGLRNTEGRTRVDYKEIEKRDKNLLKLNPILTFTEEDVHEYLRRENIPLHPLYSKELPDGRRYRSLGCEPCTNPIYDSQNEREGRWAGTSKCGGECGIHTRPLRESYIPISTK